MSDFEDPHESFRAWRKRHYRYRTDAARHLQVSAQTVKLWETGRGGLPPDIKAKVDRADFVRAMEQTKC